MEKVHLRVIQWMESFSCCHNLSSEVTGSRRFSLMSGSWIAGILFMLKQGLTVDDHGVQWRGATSQ
jgi:hypothetical protein